MTTPALEFRDLHLAYVVRGTPREVLRGVSFAVQPGESYGLVGESGCGKSTAAYAAVRYLPRNARILSGSVELAGRDVMSLDNTSCAIFVHGTRRSSTKTLGRRSTPPSRSGRS